MERCRSTYYVKTYVFGGSNEDWCKEVVFNTAINAFVADGSTQSTDFPYTKALQQGQVTGGFVTAVSPDLSSVVYTTMLGTGLLPCSIRARSNGDVAVISSLYSASTTIPVTPGAYRTANTGIADRAVIVLTSSGDLRYGSFVGGCANEMWRTFRNSTFLEGIELGPCSWRLVVGSVTFSTAFPTTAGTYLPVYPGLSSLGVCIFQTARPDSAIVSATPTCGEYLFTGTSSGFGSCAALNTFFDFGNGGGWQSGSTQTCRYTKNGSYPVSMKVVYPGGDTSYWNTTLVVQSQPTVRATPQVMYRCSKDSGRFAMATGAVRYEWRPKAGLSDSTVASPRMRPMQNTKYYVRGYDANGCYAEDSVQVFVSNITTRLSAVDTAICAGTSVNLKASGAQSITWSPSTGLNTNKGGVVIASPALTTKYTVIVSEGDCADTGAVVVRVAHAPRVQLSPSATVCAGGSTQLGASVFGADSLDTVGVRFQWKPAGTLNDANIANPIAAPFVTTRYMCTAVNRFGCMRSDSVTVKVQPTLELTLSADTAICRGSSVQLKASGGAQYSWTPKEGLDDSTKAAPICTPSRDMTYTVVTWSGVYAKATCRDTAVMKVLSIPFPAIHASGSRTVCPQTDVVLHARIDSTVWKGLRPSWFDNTGSPLGEGDSIRVRPDSTTLYTVRISLAQGCESRDTVRVTVSQKLDVRARTFAPVRAGSIVMLSLVDPQPETEYVWSDFDGNIVGGGDSCRVTVYQRKCFVVYARRGGCDGRDTVCIDVRPDEAVKACDPVSICLGDTARLYVVNPLNGTSYAWRTEDNGWSAVGDSVEYRALVSGKCYVVATSGGDTSTDSVNVTVHRPPMLLARDTTACEGQAISLSIVNPSSDDTHQWFDGAGSVVSTARSLLVEQPATTTYTIRATSIYGCVTSVTLQLSTVPVALVRLGLSVPDSLEPGAPFAIDVVAQASDAIPAYHIRSTIAIPSLMISSNAGSSKGDSLLIPVDTVVSVDQRPRVIASYAGVCLVSPFEQGAINLQVSPVDSTICIAVRSSSRPFVVHHKCGNTLLGIELRQGAIRATVSSTGEAVLTGSEQIYLYDLMGRLLTISEPPSKAGEMTTLRVSGLPAGVYVARYASFGMTSTTFVVP